MRTLLIVGLIATATFAQTPIGIASVTNFDTGDTRLAPGSRALIRLTSLIIGPGQVSALVGGRPAAVLVQGEDRLILALPIDVPLGAAELILTSRGVASPPVSIILVPHAPVLASTQFWPGVYCPVLAPWGTTLVAYGLGRTDPIVPAGAVAPASPLASTVVKPEVIVGGRQAEVLRSNLVPGRTNDGSYAIDFRVPPGTPDGNHPILIRIGGQYSNTEILRVSGAAIRSSASHWEGSVAPGALYSAYACAAELTASEVLGDSRNPPSELGGTTIRLTDSAGVERVAPLLYVAPRQANFIVPAGAADGPAVVRITTGDGSVVTTPVQVEAVAPALFTSFESMPVGWVVRVRDGVQTYEQLFRNAEGRREGVPIDLGPETDQVFLVLLGTGIRGRRSLGSVEVTIDGIDAAVMYAGAQSEFAGVDQLNIRLPRSLDRSGELREARIVVEGRVANVLYLSFR